MLDPQGKALCPLARTFADKEANPFCRGDGCAVYRLIPCPTSHPNWKAAVLQVAIEIDDKSPPKARAARVVADNPEQYGMKKFYGYCGLGGAI